MFHVKHLLFADTEPAENLFENVGIHADSKNFIESADSLSDVQRHQFNCSVLLKSFNGTQYILMTFFKSLLVPEIWNDGIVLDILRLQGNGIGNASL
jgi:hypothetical protein